MSFESLLRERILILDGAIGTQIQALRLTEEDFRGERFASWPCDLRGNNDILCLTRPEAVAGIARAYVEAGADIISTNTFNANRISMADYGMESLCREINREGAALLRRVADGEMESRGRKVWVAGSIGPTNKTASMSPDVNDPGMRAVTYDELFDAYAEQIEGLMDGGADLLLFETVFDTLNLKAGLEAASEVMERRGHRLPVMVSVTIAGRDGRTFSGQTLEAFVASVSHAPITTIGLNCSFGPREIGQWLRELSRISPWPVSCHPNAGLPDVDGNYSETPGGMAEVMRSLAAEGIVNIIGGCCGTTPAHIACYRDIVKSCAPRRDAAVRPSAMRLSGLEMTEVLPERFVGVGERCNVAGSRKFLRLISEGSLDEALGIARRQVEDGAPVIDINMDDGLLDTRVEMCRFLNLIAAEPDIARVPVMIDSSRWDVIEAALKCVQGKGIVNSISLKEGEEEFLRRARRLRRLGAAVVVMAFDEEGQADVYERKIAVCGRAYRLLTREVGFPPEDIIFDPNILAIATGIEEHDRYGADFIRAVEWIKANLPGAKVSGGVSNLSFSFRGNNYLREAMHAVFLYHAIAAGMDMAILNPAMRVTYDDIEPELRSLIEDVVLCRRPGAASDLTAWAQAHSARKDGPPREQESAHEAWRDGSVEERLEYALVHGVETHLADDLAEALAAGADPVELIDGPLMGGMNRVGTLFGEGKMFLPQVVKTARTMKRAVAVLQPEIDRRHSAAPRGGCAGKIIFATVKGDVHDIGKNIVSIVLACNGYEVMDLGVMVSAATIVETALRERPDIVCLSGLITPSLDEMARVVTELRRAGLDIPVMVGGATTSRRHTALKLDPLYDGAVIHVPDASQNPLLAARLLNPATREEYIATLKAEAIALREADGLERARRERLTPEQARSHRPAPGCAMTAPLHPGRHDVEIKVGDVRRFFNPRAFMTAWSLPASLGSAFGVHDCPACRRQFEAEHGEKGREALRLATDAVTLLDELEGHAIIKGRVELLPARSAGEEIIIGRSTSIPTPRRLTPDERGECPALADFVAEADDWVGVFALRVDLSARIAECEAIGDSYGALLLQTVAHRLAEAASEWLHRYALTTLWGLPEVTGIRPAVGYPVLPDQRLNLRLCDILDVEEIGITLTENGAMHPSASVSGLYLPSPQGRYFLL